MTTPAISYTDGFDDYGAAGDILSAGAWPGSTGAGTITLITGRKSYKNAVRLTSSSYLSRPTTASEGLYLHVGGAFRAPTAMGRCLMRFSQLSVSAQRPSGNDLNCGLWIYLNGSGQIVAAVGEGISSYTVIGVSSETVGINEWHYIEVAAMFAKGPTGWVKVWLNGKLVISAQNVATTKDVGLGVWGFVDLSTISGPGQNVGLDTDDVFIGVAESVFGDAEALGDSRVYSFVPTHNATVDDWTNEGGAGSIAAALADTNDATYAETAEVDIPLLVTSDNAFDVVPAVIHAVTVAVRARKTDIGVASIVPHLAGVQGSEESFQAESFSLQQWTYTNNPATTDPWQPEDIDSALEFGIHVIDQEA